MKIIIVDTSEKMLSTTVNVHLSNCVIIKDYLEKQGHDVSLYVSSSKIFNFDEQFDIFLVSYGARYFDHEKFKRLYENQKNCRLGWITNDYNLAPNSAFYNDFDFIISNHDQKKRWQKQNYYMMNLNSLIYRNDIKRIAKKYDCVYYGTFRENREHYFQKYLNTKNIFLSCSKKNIRKFKFIGCSPRIIEKMHWEKDRETLRHFKKSLYIEDDKTHAWFSNVANRFYESLACWSIPLIDINCRSTFERSEFDVDDLIFINKIDDISKSYDFNFEKMREIAWSEKQNTLKEFERVLGVEYANRR